MNNLVDISMNRKYGALCGYTQEELESCFSDYLNVLAGQEGCSHAEILQMLRASTTDSRLTVFTVCTRHGLC